jgi:hypothetical protein
MSRQEAYIIRRVIRKDLMTTRSVRLFFWTGLLLYAVGLFLPAVGGRGVITPRPPSVVAWGLDSFLFPLIYTHLNNLGRFFDDSPIENISVAISGWINPAFLLATVFLVVDKTPRTTAIWRYVVLLMIPFTWIAFMHDHVYPREGYFLWIVGMALVLNCNARKASHG